MAAASLPGARNRRPRDRGSRRRAYAVACLLAACIVLVPAYVALVLSSNSDAARTGAASGDGANGATDRDARMTFHRSAGALGLRILRDAPPRTLAVRGRRLAVLCGHRAGSGVSLAQRRLEWKAGSRTARLSLPAHVLGAMEFCSLSDRGRTVARVVFP